MLYIREINNCYNNILILHERMYLSKKTLWIDIQKSWQKISKNGFLLVATTNSVQIRKKLLIHKIHHQILLQYPHCHRANRKIKFKANILKF